MAVSFVRQLGSDESGVQLNPLRDNSEIPSPDNQDQMFGIMMRCGRGRIDRPFLVTRDDVKSKIGKGESMRASALNEAWVQVVEALDKGAYAAVIQRLVTDKAKVKTAVVTLDKDTHEVAFSVSDSAPEGEYLLAIKHLECFSDGIILQLHASEKRNGGAKVANDTVTLRVADCDGNILYEISGSLDRDAKDDYGTSAYLPDVVEARTSVLDVSVGMVGATIDPASPLYGYGTNGQEKWVTSDVLVCFEEGGTDYTTDDYAKAREKLQATQLNYGFISSGGSRSPAFLAQLGQLAFDCNRIFRFDIPGELTPEAAIAFAEQLNFGANKTAHLIQMFWSPLKSNDPTGVNGKGYFGTATLNIALSCSRNAQTNEKGFAPKNYAIAGKEWPVERTGIEQTYTPSKPELERLAKAKINPVIYQTFSGGGRYVFSDCLTCAPVKSSLKKLASVAEMSADIDTRVTEFCNGVIHLPMAKAVSRTESYLKDLFEGAQTSKWLVPSDEPGMMGRGWAFTVQPNKVNPYDQMDVGYWCRYDGTARRIFVTQTITR